ncbi:MAG TPA: aminotransferase class III-fold pyridoxal phosphate-dependent enzyme [Anaerolineales bacterium]|nr:aminotransferase class III-fold pyridoxal phosphate-dependent enzyme [Anaerolineales bacterium]
MTSHPLPDLPPDDILRLSLKHNFWTWSAQSRVQPIPVERAEGVYFWDTHGKRYLDFNSMTMCSNIGHGNRRVAEAIAAQAKELAYAGPGMATKPRALLGKLLAERTPGDLDIFLYTLGGAEANENAIKLARAATGRHKILARYRSYHGASHGAMAATGDPRRWAWEPMLMPGVVHFFDPFRYRSALHPGRIDVPEAEFAQDYLAHLEDVISLEGPETVAAVLIETVTGTNGVIVPPEGYLQGVRHICDRHGILLICDEVMSGFGRTGAWFAVDHWGVVPDMITMAKGLTSGYAPLGAVAMRPAIAAAFADRVFQGGLTYNGHPVSLAAAIANILVMEDDGLIERARQRGKLMARMMRELGEAHPSVGDVRSIGLFGAIELVRNRATREPMAPFNASSKEMDTLRRHLLDRGLFLYTHWNILLLLPPLIISEDELREGFAILDEGLRLVDMASS